MWITTRRLTAAAAAVVLSSAFTAPAAAQTEAAFPKQVYAARRAKLLDATGDAAVIVPGRYQIGEEGLPKQDPDFWYLTGVESPYAVLVMVRQAGRTRTALFLPDQYQFAGAQYPMSDEAFRRATWNRPLRRLSPGKATSDATGIEETYTLAELDERLKDIVGAANTVFLPLGEGRLYAPPGFIAPVTVAAQMAQSIAARLPKRTLRDVTPLITRLRLIKDAHEIAALRKAAQISGQGLVAAMRHTQPGLNDREIAGLMEYVWKQAGSTRASFPPIVASGPNAMTFFSLMGENYDAVDRVMQSGDLLYIDYGAAEYRTYTSDLCRTIPVSGRFTPEQRKYYDIVLEAQLAAIDAIKPGVMMVDVIKKSAEVYRRYGLEQYEDVSRMGEDRVWGLLPSPTHYLTKNAGIVPYTPRGVGVRDLGHHIGLSVYDSRDYSIPLQPGMVVTVEPKIYIPEKQIAIMIEDMVLVTPDGHDVLSSSTPKTAADIEANMDAARGARALGPETVAFPSDDLTLHGILWKPEGPGPFPAVLFNHGSESSPRELKELGPLFVSRGYVLFVPMRRGQGLSVVQGPFVRDVLADTRRTDGDAAWSRDLVRLLATDHLDDQLAGLAYLKGLPFVDTNRLVIMGGSFGGIETVLAAERQIGIRAAVDFAGGAETWASSSDLRERLKTAVRNAKVPIYFIQAENDYDTSPSRELSAEMQKAGKPYKMKIYPPSGTTKQQGHTFGVHRPDLWAPDVFPFLEEAFRQGRTVR
jgi:Xaa-Pro aminopeptidase/dienelactone hydrolase